MVCAMSDRNVFNSVWVLKTVTGHVIECGDFSPVKISIKHNNMLSRKLFELL